MQQCSNAAHRNRRPHVLRQDSPDVYLTNTFTTSSTDVRSAPHAAFALPSRCSFDVCLLIN